MDTWIDFKELRARVKIADVLKHHGIELNVTRDLHDDINSVFSVPSWRPFRPEDWISLGFDSSLLVL